MHHTSQGDLSFRNVRWKPIPIFMHTLDFKTRGHISPIGGRGKSSFYYVVSRGYRYNAIAAPTFYCIERNGSGDVQRVVQRQRHSAVKGIQSPFCVGVETFLKPNLIVIIVVTTMK